MVDPDRSRRCSGVLRPRDIGEWIDHDAIHTAVAPHSLILILIPYSHFTDWYFYHLFTIQVRDCVVTQEADNAQADILWKL